MISVKVLLSLGAVAAVLAGVTAYRWHHPCATCPISMAIGVLGGPAGCAPAAKTGADTDASNLADSDFGRLVAPSPGGDTMNQADMKMGKTDPAAAGVHTEMAMFGAGCFWGVEATLRKIPGVVEATSGYSGGTLTNPKYKEVCTDTTGHAEVVRVTFDTSKVSYRTLVETFFRLHDPTQVDRQGPDYGRQYRSAIFFYSPEQQKTAAEVKQRLTAAGKYTGPIATEITKADTFWPAEEYHQKYLEKNGLDNCHLPPAD